MKRLTLIAAVAAAFAATGAFAQSGPIKIGVVTPLTGTYAGIGQQVKWGIDMAIKEINDKGGKRYKQRCGERDGKRGVCKVVHRVSPGVWV